MRAKVAAQRGNAIRAFDGSIRVACFRGVFPVRGVKAGVIRQPEKAASLTRRIPTDDLLITRLLPVANGR